MVAWLIATGCLPLPLPCAEADADAARETGGLLKLEGSGRVAAAAVRSKSWVSFETCKDGGGARFFASPSVGCLVLTCDLGSGGEGCAVGIGGGGRVGGGRGVLGSGEGPPTRPACHPICSGIAGDGRFGSVA